MIFLKTCHFFVILRYWKVNSFFEVKVPNCDIKTHVGENAQNLKITRQNFAYLMNQLTSKVIVWNEISEAFYVVFVTEW